jgi:hypothetical protein
MQALSAAMLSLTALRRTFSAEGFHRKQLLNVQMTKIEHSVFIMRVVQVVSFIITK